MLTGFVGCSANWTGCAVVFYLVSGRLWTNYPRRWMRPTSEHYWTSIMTIGRMRIGYSNVSWLLAVLSVLKSLPNFSLSNPGREEGLRLKRTGGRKTQEIRCCLRARALLLS